MENNEDCCCNEEERQVVKHWAFPLTRPHTGLLFGNGTMGVMVYGEGNTLRVCIGRSDVWDHNGGVDWGNQTFEKICEVLDKKDEEALTKLFPPSQKGPTIIPIGRVEFDLPKDYILRDGEIDLRSGIGFINIQTGDESNAAMVMVNSLKKNVFCINLNFGGVKGRSVSAWDSIGETLKGRGFKAAQKNDAKNKRSGGWYQALPNDPGYYCGWEISDRQILISVEVDDAKKTGKAKVEENFAKFDIFKEREKLSKFWEEKNSSLPYINIPDESLTELYNYGIYKFIIATCMSKVACGLQGPWIEDYQLPPWASDYHFNINVQMCYWPAYQSGLLDSLLPVFNMLKKWKPRLRFNAKKFIGINDGYMLPHAVDDMGKCMGNFWTGMLDHGCTMWMATMMYRYFDYSNDVAFMKSNGFDFMKGAFNVFYAMLKEEKDGSLSLPFGVSPEFGGASMNAYGKNPSFQLAVAHRLTQDLVAAAKALKEDIDPRWLKLLKKLPKACIFNHPNGSKQIGLWEGKNLDVSHRHHSHLGAIAPFDVIDCEDPAWRKIVNDSITNWIYWGQAMWTGWCITWASMLHTHMGNGDMSAMFLKMFNDVFTNEGGGTLHDTFAAGISLFGMSVLPDEAEKEKFAKRGEIMQLDGGMGAVAALFEMLVMEKNDVIHIFRGYPKRWAHGAFDNVMTKHGLRIGAARAYYDCAVVMINTPKHEIPEVKLANPFKDKSKPIVVKSAQGDEIFDGVADVLSLKLKPESAYCITQKGMIL